MADNVVPFIKRQSPAFQAKVSRDTSAKPTLEEEAHKARTYNPKGEDLPTWKPR